MDWNWDHLRYFLALARSGTLSLAAQQLQVSHATVYRRIKQFEDELATRLFEKTSTGYLLTHKGAELLREVEKVEHSVDGISRQFVGADQRVEGDIVIATTDSLGYRIMPSVIQRLKATYPALRIDLRVGTSTVNVMRGEADIAVRTTKTPPESLVGRKVGSVGFSACAAQSYLRRYPTEAFPDDVAGHSFIVLSEQFAGTPMQKWLMQNLDDDSDVTVTNGVMSVLELCRAGVGIAILPSYLLSNDDELIELPSTPAIPCNDLWVLVHKDLRDAARIKTTRQFIATALAEHFAN